VYTTSVKKANLNTTALRQSWRAVVLLPPRHCRRPLCNPRVVGGVREGVSWTAIVSSDRQLGGSLREHLSLMGRPPLVAACGVADPHGTGPPPVDRASTSTDAAAANASPAHCAESWKSAIIVRCCSCVGWVPTGGAPVAEQVVQLKLQWWCVPRSRWFKHWLLNR
jgi:hypothetical protein